MNYDALKQAVGDLEEEQAMAMLHQLMEREPKQASRAMEACQEGMGLVGKRFEEGEYFVGDLIFAGELMTQAVEILQPALLKKTGGEVRQMELILCTVAGDLHDIGKNIVKAMLEAGGFTVVDLGIDVQPEMIVKTAQERQIHIIALSGVLTLALDSMKETVEAFQKAGMRDLVKIIVGGAPVTAAAIAQTGADEWAVNPQKTVSVCQQWAKEQEANA